MGLKWVGGNVPPPIHVHSARSTAGSEIKIRKGKKPDLRAATEVASVRADHDERATALGIGAVRTG